jgi:hypothetical protein
MIFSVGWMTGTENKNKITKKGPLIEYRKYF